MRDTYDKLEAIKYTSDNGNPYWLFNDLKRELGIIGTIAKQIPGHCMKMHINGVVDYALSLRIVYYMVDRLNMTEVKVYMLGRGDYDRANMIYEHLMRIRYRDVLKDKDRDLNSYIKRNVGVSKIPAVKSIGDEGLFGYSSKAIKNMLNISNKSSIYDYFSSTLLMARITAIDNTLKHDTVTDAPSMASLYKSMNSNERKFVLSHYINPIDELSPLHVNDLPKLIDSYRSELDNYTIAFCPFALPN